MVITIAKHIAWQEYFGKVYIFDEYRHQIFLLSSSARSAWMALIEANSICEAAQICKQRYRLTNFNKIYMFLTNFVKSLKKEGIINEKG